jgi:hypothetical protein
MFLFDVGWMGYGMAGMGMVGGVTSPTHHFFPKVLCSMRSRFQAGIKEEDPYFLLFPLSTFISIYIFWCLMSVYKGVFHLLVFFLSLLFKTFLQLFLLTLFWTLFWFLIT